MYCSETSGEGENALFKGIEEGLMIERMIYVSFLMYM